MKKVLFLCFFACLGIALQAQDPVKDMKKAARLLGTYNLDPTLSADKLSEAVTLANSSINDPLVQADPLAWQAYGDIFMTIVNNDVARIYIDAKATISDPTAPGKAFTGFKKAAELADKSYQTKDAMEGLSGGLQNIYYMGSALYQTGEYKAAYEAFKATYDGFKLLKKNSEPTTFDPEEVNKALYYSGLCAQQAGMMTEAKTVYAQLVEEGIAEPGVYEALIKIYEKEDPALSEKYLMAGREKYPDDTALLYAEINYLLAKGELETLVSKLEKALTLEPNNISIYITLGQIYDKLYQDKLTTDPVAAEENFNKAMSYYQQALVKDPKSFDATYSIGALWYNKAAGYSVELNAFASDVTPAGNKKWDAKKAQMDETFVKALPFFLQAEVLNPKDMNTLVALKEIYARQDKFDLVQTYKQKIEALGSQ